ncbi:MAG TPA: class I SAM-dependent methyltransferase, partial [Gaiella sp.]|nr:class I SAM-dependent methyltransferase [Gaiella sp.]
GRLLFALVAPNPGCEVLEIGGSRGYSTIWLAAAARILGGRVVSLEQDAAKIEAWRRNVAEAGLDEWAELVTGDARETLPALEEGWDVVFVDAWKDDYEWYFQTVRPKLEPGAVVIADNVSSSEAVQAYARARQADPTLVSVTVPIGHGLEVTTLLKPPPAPRSTE